MNKNYYTGSSSLVFLEWQNSASNYSTVKKGAGTVCLKGIVSQDLKLLVFSWIYFALIPAFLKFVEMFQVLATLLVLLTP
jgi:hypothetical protein